MLLSAQIKKETKIQHQELERILIPKIKSIQSLEDYAHLLRLFYGYFAPIEKEIGIIKDSRLSDFDLRRKSETIIIDLKFLNSQEKTNPLPLHDSPIIRNFPQALGALYVMEGSTLGGRIISKMIGRQLNLKSEEGLSFFKGYGDATEKMWGRFIHILNDPNLTLVEKEEVIFSAKNTFVKFIFLVEQHYKSTTCFASINRYENGKV